MSTAALIDMPWTFDAMVRLNMLPLTGGRVQATLAIAANEWIASHDGISASRAG